MDDGHGRDVECEARRGLEGAQATLAEHDVVVTRHGDVVGRGEPLGDRPGETALEQHHLVRVFRHLTDVLQQAEILEVASSHLQTVDIGVNHLAVLGVHDLRQCLQTVLVSPSLHDLQRLLAEALETVGVGAGLERAAADPMQAEARDALGDFVELLFALDRTRAGENGDLVGQRSVIG